MIASKINYLRNINVDADLFEEKKMKAENILHFVKEKVNQMLDSCEKEDSPIPKGNLYHSRSFNLTEKNKKHSR